jgi:hypothetical protein
MDVESNGRRRRSRRSGASRESGQESRVRGRIGSPHAGVGSPKASWELGRVFGGKSGIWGQVGRKSRVWVGLGVPGRSQGSEASRDSARE